MGTPDLDRLQADVGLLRAIVGTELPFDQRDVRFTLAIGCCALLPAVAGVLGFSSPWVLLVSAVPFVSAVIGTLWWNYRASHPRYACSRAKRIEYRVGTPAMLACLPLMVGFHYWATHAGAPAAVANGCILLFLGLILLMRGVTSAERRADLFPGAAGVAGGLLWPFCEYLPFWTLLWSGVAVALIASACWMKRQLASREQV